LIEKLLTSIKNLRVMSTGEYYYYYYYYY